MSPLPRFRRSVVAGIDESRIVGIRAGSDHPFTGVWAVVVEGRVFVRSWNDKPTGWHRAFGTQPRGALQVPGRKELPVRARRVSGVRLLAAIDDAYARKFSTPASRKWVRGFARGKRRLTTTELVPA